MLTGSELGAAIEAARKKKRITKKALADHFGVTPPSIQDWVNRGTIDKEKLPALWHFFSDVVGPDHWGLRVFPDGGALEPTLAQSFATVADAIGRLSSGRWTMIKARLDDLPGHPEMRDDVIADVLPLLQLQLEKQADT